MFAGVILGLRDGWLHSQPRRRVLGGEDGDYFLEMSMRAVWNNMSEPNVMKVSHQRIQMQ